MGRVLNWLGWQIRYVARGDLPVWPLLVVSELLAAGYWLQFRERCTGTANSMKLMLMCHGGDDIFGLEFFLVAPAIAAVWHLAREFDGKVAAWLRAGVWLYLFGVRFVVVWLMAHWQVVTWADLV